MTPPTPNTVTVRRDKRLDPRLRRKNLQSGGDSESVALPPASYTPNYEVFTVPITSSSTMPSHTSSNTLARNNASQPASIMKRRSDSFEAQYPNKHRRIADEFYPKDSRGLVESKLQHRMQSSSTSSYSVQSLGRYFLRGYVVHKQTIIRAWQQIVWKMDRSGPLMYHVNLQNRLLTAFYAVNDAVGNGCNAKEFRNRIANDFSIYAPTAFFYAGLIGTDSTISHLQKMLGVWFDRHYFKDRTIMRFCDMLDEGVYFGDICGRKDDFDDTKLWQNQSFREMYSSLLTYCYQSLPFVAGCQKHFQKLTDNTGRVLTDLEPLLKWCKITRNYSTLKGIFDKLLSIQAEASTVGDDIRYVSSVVIHLMMLSQFVKKAAKRSRKAR
uniref:CID domain-containing protein n=1 Tax=Panagrellus redivivus TaxID=6233 RepID=A0A7E4ZTN9_PANRE